MVGSQAIPYSYFMDTLGNQKNCSPTDDEKIIEFETYVNSIVRRIGRGKPNPSLENEKDALKVVFSELKKRLDKARKEMDQPKAAYYSVLEEIYHMPGSFNELRDLLKCQGNLDSHDEYLITQHWIKRYDNGSITKGPSMPQEDTGKREFLTTKCAEVATAKKKLFENRPLINKLQKLVQGAGGSLRMILRQFPDHKDGSSSS